MDRLQLATQHFTWKKKNTGVTVCVLIYFILNSISSIVLNFDFDVHKITKHYQNVDTVFYFYQQKKFNKKYAVASRTILKQTIKSVNPLKAYKICLNINQIVPQKYGFNKKYKEICIYIQK